MKNFSKRWFVLLLLGIWTHLFSQTLVLAGGGAEGDIGDQSSWSYQAYKQLWNAGDINGDGVVSVAILSTTLPTDRNWLPDYFNWIGSTMGYNTNAFNVKVDSRTKANSSSTIGSVLSADAIFLRGGDQGEYYDLWNNTLLEDYIREVVTNGGGIGGTSAGAMSLAQYCFASGEDLVSTDVLYNAKTPYLNDLDGGSGIHNDFLSFVQGAFIDAHYTWRARLGRMIGIVAKAVDDFSTSDIIGVGVEEYTALVIENSIGTVIGHGEVAILDPRGYQHMQRQSGQPLLFSNLTLHRLADGWQFNFSNKQVIPPTNVELVQHSGANHSSTGTVTINGSSANDDSFFEKIIEYDPYNIHNTGQTGFLAYSMGFTDAFNTNDRGLMHEAIFNGLKDEPDFSAFLVYRDSYYGAEGILRNSSAQPDLVSFEGNLASVVIDAGSVQYAGFAQTFSSKNGVTNTAALTPLKVHVLANSPESGLFYNVVTHQVVDENQNPLDTDPPVFSGLQTAETGAESGTVDLMWNEATDPSLPIAYQIYQSQSSGNYDYSNPIAITTQLNITISGLNEGETYFFVVRAKDAAGNVDGNEVERSAVAASSGASVLTETEPNDYRDEANDLNGNSLPLVVEGTIDISSDYDYYAIYLSKGQTLSLRLDIPSNVDYDLYLENSRGKTKARSTNDGLGMGETITYNNSRNGTYYILVKSWTGSNDTDSYHLTISIPGLLKIGNNKDSEQNFIPQTLSVSKSYPNPFNPITTIRIELPESQPVTMTIFSVSGQQVYQWQGILDAGIHQLQWKGINQSGIPVSSGMYLMKVQAGNKVKINKVLLLK
ncbi:MAG: hypothetical protein Kow00108_22760 [Calditrichia bacterium]